MRFLKDDIATSGWLLGFFLLLQHATSYIVTTPKNTLAMSGESVTLECATNLSTPVRWKYESFDGANPEIIYYNEVITESLRSRYKIETSVRGTFNLVIEKVDRSYAGTYKCGPTVYPDERESAFSARLIVLASEPVCDTNTSSFSSDGVEGDTIKMSCGVRVAGCWRPVMHWSKNNGKNIGGSVLLNETTVSIISSLIIQLNSSDNDVIYSCKIYFFPNSTCPQKADDIWAMNKPEFQRIWNYTTNVLYGPRNIRIYPTQSTYQIDDRIWCSADGNPTPTYKWTEIGNRSRDVPIDGRILTVDETMASDHELFFQCTATYTVGRKRKDISETIKFNVTGNHLRRRVLQTYILSIALPVVCSIVLLALVVGLYQIIRFCNKPKMQNQDIASRHEYETVSDLDFQNEGSRHSRVIMSESIERQETGTDDGYMELTEKQTVVYSQLHEYVDQNEDTRSPMRQILH